MRVPVVMETVIVSNSEPEPRSWSVTFAILKVGLAGGVEPPGLHTLELDVPAARFRCGRPVRAKARAGPYRACT